MKALVLTILFLTSFSPVVNAQANCEFISAQEKLAQTRKDMDADKKFIHLLVDDLKQRQQIDTSKIISTKNELRTLTLEEQQLVKTVSEALTHVNSKELKACENQAKEKYEVARVDGEKEELKIFVYGSERELHQILHVAK